MNVKEILEVYFMFEDVGRYATTDYDKIAYHQYDIIFVQKKIYYISDRDRTIELNVDEDADEIIIYDIRDRGVRQIIKIPVHISTYYLSRMGEFL